MLANTLFIILNLVILESLLSIDNAAVLAIMVKDLPAGQRNKALKYGLMGAYFFRSLCLLFVGFLVHFAWLKAAGGLYLCYLAWKHFTADKDSPEEGTDGADKGWYRGIYNFFQNKIGIFWTTVVMVEIMDLAFSIDNVFAAAAFSDKIVIVIIGVCLGITAMRFISQVFLKLMERYPSLETAAFIVIALLGIKLVLTATCQYIAALAPLNELLHQHSTDLVFSLGMLGIFVVTPFVKGNKLNS